MKPNNAAVAPARYGYGLLMFLLALTGFAQMPIFKRYYIADIPGLGWLAKFYITHYLHYMSAAAMVALAAYFLTAYLRTRPARPKLSLSGKVRVGLTGVALASGILLAVKNFPGYAFSPGTIIALDLIHLGSVVAFIAVAIYCAIFSKRWLISSSQSTSKGVH